MLEASPAADPEPLLLLTGRLCNRRVHDNTDLANAASSEHRTLRLPPAMKVKPLSAHVTGVVGAAPIGFTAGTPSRQRWAIRRGGGGGSLC